MTNKSPHQETKPCDVCMKIPVYPDFLSDYFCNICRNCIQLGLGIDQLRYFGRLGEERERLAAEAAEAEIKQETNKNENP